MRVEITVLPFYPLAVSVQEESLLAHGKQVVHELDIRIACFCEAVRAGQLARRQAEILPFCGVLYMNPVSYDTAA